MKPKLNRKGNLDCVLFANFGALVQLALTHGRSQSNWRKRSNCSCRCAIQTVCRTPTPQYLFDMNFMAHHPKHSAFLRYFSVRFR